MEKMSEIERSIKDRVRDSESVSSVARPCMSSLSAKDLARGDRAAKQLQAEIERELDGEFCASMVV